MLDHYALFDCFYSLMHEYPRSYLNINRTEMEIWLERSFRGETADGWGYMTLMQTLPQYDHEILEISARVQYGSEMSLAGGPHVIATIFIGDSTIPAFYVMQ